MKKILKIIKLFVLVILVVFIILVVLQRFSDNRISFFNYRMFTVISGSMRPKYDIGDVLISKEVEPSKIEVGDAISYLGTKGDFKGKVITHEVIEVNQDEDGKYVFRAKGIANIIEDPEVYEDQLFGVVVYRARILSFIYRIVATRNGFFLFIIIPLMFIIISEAVGALLKREDNKRGKI